MVSHLFFYQLTLIALVWLCVMLQWVWPSDPTAVCPTTPEPPLPPPKRHRAPQPFEGLITKPHCDACAHASAPHPHAPSAPPPGRHLDALLSEPGLCLSGLGRLGQSPRQWPPQWRPLAAVALHRLSPLLLGEPRHDLSWEARLRRAHRARHRVPGRRLGYPGHGAGVRGGPQYRAAVAGRSSGAAAGLLPTCPARRAGPAGPTR